ncbi:toll/interleukin-1 receptor domain-containing protein [Streptomyces clavuligerus]|uniref:toll/interleukin-1 receptor domain-containing protein n=1 Tax=Streptomyces clavuligerus TaxID=1901 RepID=UPI000185197F|nr:toll/interleukin-1 receptor domain-containing protein [Streptomyces clavuligerus]WDN50715.1 toll/interleukin-1 receptor domain-containing protein [Streptomyces clavuligerus]
MSSENTVTVGLTLIDEGSRQIDTAPDGIRIGAVSLGMWQEDAVSTPADMRDDWDTYLIRINYELELMPGLPPLTWFEIGVDFASDAPDPAFVVDALPHAAPSPQPRMSYTLNRYLALVPTDFASSAVAHLPSTTDVINVFGIGRGTIRWQHSSSSGGVPEGARSAWAVLAVPKGRMKQRVDFSVRYAVHSDKAMDYRPTQQPVSFTLTLSAPPQSRDEAELPTPNESAERPPASPPYVFISYAHDDARRKENALRFGELLRQCGIDAHMDQWDCDERGDWSLWAIRHILAADFTIVLASPMCKAVGNGNVDHRTHRGLQSELGQLRELLHTDGETWVPKILPVVLPGERVEDLPLFLRPYTMDHYRVDEFACEEIEDLLSVLTRRPRRTRPPLGPGT